MIRFVPACVLLLFAAPGFSAERKIGLEEFVREAAERDTRFAEILQEQLKVRYRSALRLPSQDLTLSVQEQFELGMDAGEDGVESSVALSRLFRKTGTEASVRYSATPRTGARVSSSFSAKVSQPIAENAFGRSTRLLERIVGNEIAVAKFQVAEAYEDYFARTIEVFLNWYEAYENLRIGEASFETNKKLLDNVRQRRRSRIAIEIDVNKVTLQVYSKEERLLSLREAFERTGNVARAALRYAGDERLIPAAPEGFEPSESELEEGFEDFRTRARTSEVLGLLDKNSALSLKREADDLLPSIALFAGYERTGTGTGLEDPTSAALGGISLAWPFGHQVDRAEKEVAKIERDRVAFDIENTFVRLDTQFKNLKLALDREQRLLEIAGKKIELAESVLRDETENYTFGKVTLNDYIDAVNSLDNQRFNRLAREVAWRKLGVEWLRLRDLLIKKTPEK